MECRRDLRASPVIWRHAYVYVAGQMVNAALVEQGLAHAFFIGPNRKHNAQFVRLQNEAKQHRLGIWSVRARPRDLKITSVHLPDPANPEPHAPYVRIANLSNEPIRLAGYVLSNEGGQRYVFPDVTVDLGYVDTFHYKGKRVTRPPHPSRGKGS